MIKCYSILFLLLHCAVTGKTLVNKYQKHSEMLDKKSKNIVVSTKMSKEEIERKSKSPLHYIPTTEGLLAQLNHVFEAWNIALHFNRTLVAVRRSSHHYGENFIYGLCDVFTLNVTNEIRCGSERLNYSTVHRIKDCKIVGKEVDTDSKRNWATNTTRYHFTKEKNVIHKVDYKTVSCVAGLLKTTHLPKDIVWHHPYTKMLDFQPKYKNLLIMAKSIMIKLSDQNRNQEFYKLDYLKQWHDYYVFHWRRGDQLTTRCKDHKDISVNCKSVKEYIKAVQEQIKEFKNRKDQISSISSAQPIIYIATNEKNIEILNELSSAGFLHPVSFKQKLLKDTGIVLNMLDEFVLDLILMCNAMYYKAFGFSKIETFAMWCRGIVCRSIRI